MATPAPPPTAIPMLRSQLQGSPNDSSRMEALSWKSDVRSQTMTLEHAAVEISTDRVLYHLTLQLATPLPATWKQHTQYLCLTWPIGGLWKIKSVENNNTTVHCVTWRRTTMNRQEMAEMLAAFDAKSKSGEEPPTLFEWKMMRGVWGTDEHHWFMRTIEPPVTVPREERTLVAKLFVGFAPFEASIEINTIMAVDTVAQTFSADVTWQVSIPAITAIREDSVLRELLEILEVDAEQFEFTNIYAMQDERPLASSVTPAGEAQFLDITLKDPTHVSTETVYHLQYSRRVIATFSEEMTLHNFPFDQQKLTFDFSSGTGGMPDGPLRLTPTPVDPGSFAIANYHLGNVFDIVFYDKVFVSDIHDMGARKSICFEIMLERKSGYYLTNVALIAACITYLCFITYAPMEGNTYMDTSGRLQIVLTLLLTAVTFKNQVASLIPQVSYFTTLDKYVFFCFIVTCLVTLENAFFHLIADTFSSDKWTENGLLSFSIGSFSLVNVVWAVYLKLWVDRRRRAAKVLLETHELIRVLTNSFPADARENLLREYLQKTYSESLLPQVIATTDGHLFVELPEDSPKDERTLAKKSHVAHANKQSALTKLSEFKRMYEQMHPGAGGHRVASVSVAHAIPTARPNKAYEAGDAPPQRRRSSAAAPYTDTALTVEPFHRHAENPQTRRVL